MALDVIPSASRRVGLGDYKTRGAFFTPSTVTRFLADWAIRSESDMVLEPTCGEAAFLVEIVDVLRKRGASDHAIGEQVFGFDIDPVTVQRAAAALLSKGIRARLEVSDFFDVPTPQHIDGVVPHVQAVVGNPPFVRYQQFAGRTRAASQRAALAAGVSLSGLASSWAASLVHASRFLSPNGRIALVLPAELLTVNYAEPIRQFLHSRFERVDLVLFEQRVFEAALEDVVLLLAEGSGSCSHFRLHHVAGEHELANITFDGPRHPASLQASGKWTSRLFLPERVQALYEQVGDKHFQPLENYGVPKLGVVTGANKFFALRPSDVARLGLMDSHTASISPPGTRHLRGLVFTRQDWTDLAEADQPVHLLRLYGTVDPGHPASSLIRLGESLGVSQGYKCRCRDPWYVVPPVEIPDVFFTYMNHHFPRLVTNGAGVGCLNSMHGIRLLAHRQLAKAALPLAALNSLSLLGAEIVGRSYGGGVLKLEPREAASLPVLRPQWLAEAWVQLRPHKRRLENQLRRAGWPRVVAEVDQRILRDVLGIPTKDVRAIQDAVTSLRSRRLSRGRAA